MFAQGAASFLALLVRRITLVGPLSLLLPIRSTAFMATITKSLLHLMWLVVYRYTQPTTSPLCPAMYRRRISRTTFMRPALPLSHMICGSLSTARHSPTRHPCAGACPVSPRPDSLQACPSTDTRPPSRVPHGLLSCRRTADSRARRLT